jgi:hypothetical protein
MSGNVAILVLVRDATRHRDAVRSNNSPTLAWGVVISITDAHFAQGDELSLSAPGAKHDISG